MIGTAKRYYGSSIPESFRLWRHARLGQPLFLSVTEEHEIVCPIGYAIACLEEAAVANELSRLDCIHFFLLLAKREELMCHVSEFFHQRRSHAMVDHLKRSTSTKVTRDLIKLNQRGP